MSRARTQYNPSIGCYYKILNVKNGQVVKGCMLTKEDEAHKPFRSPAGTPVGREFFKMKLEIQSGKFIVLKFLNSTQYDKCLAPNGKWEFIGVTWSGKTVPKNGEVIETKKAEKEKAVKKQKKKNKKILTENEISQELKDSKYANKELLELVIDKLCL